MSSTEQTLGAVAGAVIGFVYGGPVGALQGAALGYSLTAGFTDIRLEGVEGPRIDDLTGQISQYGEAIPDAYGTYANTGNVIWAPPLVERAVTQDVSQGGKGGPSQTQSQTTYTYSASFAVAFCEGEVNAVRRVWANEHLIYDVSALSDYQAFTDDELTNYIVTQGKEAADLGEGIRFYPGTETQAIDSLIEATEGVGNTPAYLGTAYLVFDNMDLSRYGNRRPIIRVEYVKITGTPSTDTTPLREIDLPIGFNESGTCGLLDNDFVAHWFANDTSTDEIEYYRVYPNGTVAFRGKLNNPDGNSFVVRTNAAYPLVVTRDNVNGLHVHEPEGSLVDGDLFEYELDVTTTSNVVAYHTGNVEEGDFILWLQSATAPANTFVKVHYSKGVTLSLLFLETDISLDQDNITLPIPAGESEVEAVYVHEGYWWVLWQAGTLQKLNLDGVEIESWSVTFSAGISSTATGIYTSDNVNLYVRSVGVLYRVTYGVAEYLGSFSNTGTLSHASYDRFFAKGNILVDVRGSPLSLQKPEIAYRTILEYPFAGELLSNIVADLCEQSGLAPSDIDVTDLASTVVYGYCRTKVMPGRSAIEPLMLSYQFDGYEDSQKLIFVHRGQAPGITVDSGDLGADGSRETLPAVRADESDLPLVLNLQYLNRERDYEVVTQSSRRVTVDSKVIKKLQVPIVLTDDQARQTAEILHLADWTNRYTYRKFCLPLKYLSIVPSDVISVTDDGVTHQIRIMSMLIGQYIELSGIADAALNWVSEAPGDSPEKPYKGTGTAGPSELYLIDCPALTNSDGDTGFYMAAHGYYPGWGGAAIYRSPDPSNYAQVGAVYNPVTAGVCTTVLPDGPTDIIDYDSTVSVELRSGDLSSITQSQALASKQNNAALIGVNGRWELIQFMDAEQDSNGAYVLSGLIRGQNGTEWATETHEEDELFILLEASTLTRAPNDPDQVGVSAYYKAVSFGQPIASADYKIFTNTAVSARPLSPAHLKAESNGDGTFDLSWIRRAKVNGEWVDNRGVPLDEASEEYRVRRFDDSENLISTQTTSNTFINDFAAGNDDVIKVDQVSEFYGSGIAAEVTALFEGGPTQYNEDDKSASITLSNGNLTASRSTSGWGSVRTEDSWSEGKRYWEVTIDTGVGSNHMVGVGTASSPLGNYPGSNGQGWGYWGNGPTYHNGTGAALPALPSYTPGDVITVALDMDSGKLWFGKNGTWLEGGDPAAGLNPRYSNLGGNTIFQCDALQSSASHSINHGQSAFNYTVPTGFN